MTAVLPVLLCLAAGVSSAQAPLPLTMEDAVANAIDQNPRLSVVAGTIAAAQAGVGIAREPANPSIVFTPGITGPDGSDEELVIQQRLEVNGVRSARTGVARAQLDLTLAQAGVETNELVYRTKAAYWELARARAMLALAGEVLQIAEEFGQGVARRVEEGLEPGADRVQTVIEASRARQQAILAESAVRIATARLNGLMGDLPHTPIGELPPLAFEAVDVDREEAVQAALVSRPELGLQEASRESLVHEARLVRAEGRPDLIPHVRAESIVRERRGIGVGIGVELPFLDRGSRRSRARRVSALAEAQDARTEAARAQIRLEVEQALARLDAAESRIEEYQQGTLTQARWLLDAHLTGADIGAPDTNVLTVLEAQRTFRAVQAEHADALVEHAIARAELEWAMGMAPPEPAGRNQ